MSATTTIHRCVECRHQHVDHHTDHGMCSMGACPCGLSPHAVRDANPAVEVPIFPGFSRRTGRWGEW